MEENSLLFSITLSSTPERLTRARGQVSLSLSHHHRLKDKLRRHLRGARRPQMARVRAVVDDATVATAALEVSLLPSPPLVGPPDDGASGRRCGHRPLVDPPFGEGPRGLVP